MEELFSAIETGSVDKVKEVIDNKAVSPTVCSEVKSMLCVIMCVATYVSSHVTLIIMFNFYRHVVIT